MFFTYIHNSIKNLKNNNQEIIKLSEKLYEKAISANDIIDYIYEYYPEDEEKYKILIITQKVKKEFRNEKLLIFFILNLIVFRSLIDLENILSL